MYRPVHGPGSVSISRSSPSLNKLGPATELTLDVALQTLRTGDFHSRWEAAKVIGRSGQVAIEPLMQILMQILQEGPLEVDEDETDWELLWFVARILGDLKQPSAIPSLVQLLQTTNNADVIGIAATALANLGEVAIAPLTALLEQEAIRPLVINALAQIHHPDVIPVLQQAVDDAAPVVRTTAIEALSHFNDPAIAPLLVAALKDPAATVRQAAIVGLRFQTHSLTVSELIQHLQPFLWDTNLDVCRRAATTLGHLGSEAATTALLEVLTPSGPMPLQVEVIQALTWIGTPAVLNQLHQFLQNHPTNTPLTLALHQHILTMFGRVERADAKRQATELLIDLLTSAHPLTDDPHSKQTIVQSLGQLGQVQAIEPLVQLLADPDTRIRLHTIAALKRLNPHLAHQHLERLVAQPDISPELQAGVAIALQEWNVHSAHE